MSYEMDRIRGTYSQYGARDAGGEKGGPKTAGGFKEYTYNFDAESKENLTMPANVVIWDVIGTAATGAITVATVGGVDVSGVDGTELGAVTVAGGGELVITGPTAGDVLVKTMEI